MSDEERRRAMWDAYCLCESLVRSAPSAAEKSRLNYVVWGLHRQFQSNWGAQVPVFPKETTDG